MELISMRSGAISNLAAVLLVLIAAALIGSRLLRESPTEPGPSASAAEPASSGETSNYRGFMLRAQERTRAKQWDDAREDVRSAGELASGPLELNDAAWFLFALKDYEPAYELADKGLQIAPDQARILDTRGCALLGLGKPKEALLDFNRALELDPDVGEHILHRAWALEDLGRHAEAKMERERAGAVNPSAERVRP